MNLRREYLRFFNSGATWMVYAARDQNLGVREGNVRNAHHCQTSDETTNAPLRNQMSVPIDSSVSCPQPAKDGSRDGQPLLTPIILSKFWKP